MYSISLFLHIVGALGIFASLAFEQAGLFNLRRASTNQQAREWLSLFRTLQRVQGPSALVLLATGLYMMTTRWSHQAWAGLGLVGMVLMAIIGAAITGRRMKRIGPAVPATDGPLPAALRDRFDDPALRMSASVRVGLALGIVFNMSVKPATGGAVAALVIAMALGFAAAQFSRGTSRSIGRPAVQE
ncbi:MAG TPA: hypothetical protein VLN49_01290 [Gemmatimonadaceae bacterium]|nr:hypothetical protein [Gemmatimonadaceae bacterium]